MLRSPGGADDSGISVPRVVEEGDEDSVRSSLEEKLKDLTRWVHSIDSRGDGAPFPVPSSPSSSIHSMRTPDRSFLGAEGAEKEAEGGFGKGGHGRVAVGADAGGLGPSGGSSDIALEVPRVLEPFSSTATPATRRKEAREQKGSVVGVDRGVLRLEKVLRQEKEAHHAAIRAWEAREEEVKGREEEVGRKEEEVGRREVGVGRREEEVGRREEEAGRQGEEAGRRERRRVEEEWGRRLREEEARREREVSRRERLESHLEELQSRLSQSVGALERAREREEGLTEALEARGEALKALEAAATAEASRARDAESRCRTLAESQREAERLRAHVRSLERRLEKGAAAAAKVAELEAALHLANDRLEHSQRERESLWKALSTARATHAADAQQWAQEMDDREAHVRRLAAEIDALRRLRTTPTSPSPSPPQSPDPLPSAALLQAKAEARKWKAAAQQLKLQLKLKTETEKTEKTEKTETKTAPKPPHTPAPHTPSALLDRADFSDDDGREDEEEDGDGEEWEDGEDGVRRDLPKLGATRAGLGEMVSGAAGIRGGVEEWRVEQHVRELRDALATAERRLAEWVARVPPAVEALLTIGTRALRGEEFGVDDLLGEDDAAGDDEIGAKRVGGIRTMDGTLLRPGDILGTHTAPAVGEEATGTGAIQLMLIPKPSKRVPAVVSVHPSAAREALQQVLDDIRDARHRILDKAADGVATECVIS